MIRINSMMTRNWETILQVTTAATIDTSTWDAQALRVLSATLFAAIVEDERKVRQRRTSDVGTVVAFADFGLEIKNL